MTDTKQLTFPLLNANEPEAQLAALHVKEGQQVKVGDPLYSLETTKSTSDVDAQENGFIIGIQVEEGDTVNAGELFAYLADSADWQPPKKEKAQLKPKNSDLPNGLRITDPALILAKENKLDLNNLPIGPLVTETTVRNLLNDSGNDQIEDDKFDPKAIILYGGGGHGKSILDILLSLDTYKIVGIIDDGVAKGNTLLDIPILGTSDMLPELYQDGIRQAVNAVGGIGSVSTRIKVFNKLKNNGFTFPAIIHPTAFVEQSATLSEGAQVFPHAYVGSEAKIGFGSIINTGSIVSHDCILGDYVNISPGAMLAGDVKIGDRSLVGMGVTINLSVNIGENARIGNGATVKEDVPPKTIVRAGSIWPE